MNTTFVTGGTGYLGGYVLHELLQRSDGPIAALVRAPDHQAATEKLWRTLQMHMDATAFRAAMARIEPIYGDLHKPDLGLGEGFGTLARRLDSVVHIAASLNRKSSRVCFNTNLRGTLSVARLARAAADHHGLRRFSHVSTVAVAGQRDREVVQEDSAIDWNRSDYDPYGRTKKFAEHMICELLPDVQRTFFRPSIVMGDSSRDATSQFDMVRAFTALADMPVVPLQPNDRLDIIPANYVGEAIARLHLKRTPAHERYHLSSGRNSCTAAQISEAMKPVLGRGLRFTPSLQRPFHWTFRAMNRLPRGNALQPAGALMKVFWPYITYDTVFANERVSVEMGRPPAPFTSYCAGLYRFSKDNDFRYPYLPLPEERACAK
jgi:thioester reductase-like protein